MIIKGVGSSQTTLLIWSLFCPGKPQPASHTWTYLVRPGGSLSNRGAIGSGSYRRVQSGMPLQDLLTGIIQNE